MSSQETYSCRVSCNNCDFTGTVDIKKGETIVSALRIMRCPTCGCDTLHKHQIMPLSLPSIPYKPIDIFPRPNPKKVRPFLGDPFIHPDFKYKRYKPLYGDFKVQCSRRADLDPHLSIQYAN